MSSPSRRAQRAPGDDARQFAEEDVLGDRKVWRERELLVNDGDAVGARGARIAEVDALAVNADLARGRRHFSAEHAHERRLAGPVLPDQGVHLAGRRSKSTPRRARTPPKDLVMAVSLASSAMTVSQKPRSAAGAHRPPSTFINKDAFSPTRSEHGVLAIVLVDVLLGDDVRLGQDELRIVGGQFAFQRFQADIHGGARHEVRIVEAGCAILAFLDEGERLFLAIGGGEHQHVGLARCFRAPSSRREPSSCSRRE